MITQGRIWVWQIPNCTFLVPFGGKSGLLFWSHHEYFQNHILQIVTSFSEREVGQILMFITLHTIRSHFTLYI